MINMWVEEDKWSMVNGQWSMVNNLYPSFYPKN